MRVLVSLMDKEVALYLVPAEKEKLKGKLTLAKIGDLYEYDNGVEYCCAYRFILKKVAEYYVLQVKREDAGGNIHNYMQVKFKTYDEFTLAVTAFTRCKCVSDGSFCSHHEEEIAGKHIVATHAACSVLLDFGTLIPLLVKMMAIARKLRLF